MKTPRLFRSLWSAAGRQHGQGQTTIQPSRDVGCVPRTEGGTRPRAPAKVQFAENVAPSVEPPAKTPKHTSCTGLLDEALFANLGKLVEALPAMAAELDQLSNAVHRMRTAEAACATTTGNRSSNPLLEEQEAARLWLKGQIQRVQMALQGRKDDFTYQPDIRQVSHLGKRQACWFHLNRALQSLSRVPEPAPQVGPATQPDNIGQLVQLMAPDGLPPSPALDQLRKALPEQLGRRQAVLDDMRAMTGTDPIRWTLLEADYHNAQKDLFAVLRGYIIDSRKDLPEGHPRRPALEQTAESLYTQCKRQREHLLQRPEHLKAAGLVLVVDEFQPADKATGKAWEPIRLLTGDQRLS